MEAPPPGRATSDYALPTYMRPRASLLHRPASRDAPVARARVTTFTDTVDVRHALAVLLERY